VIAADLPPLLARNPFVLLAPLFAVLGVRAAWSATPAEAGWRGVLRLAIVFGTVSVIFNVLTAHVGDLVFARLPGWLPVVGGALTVNALVYGLLGAVAILTLVVIGITLASVLDWTALLRLLPPRLTTVAVAGSVAWTLVPRTVIAFGEIREAQSARGHRPRGVRDLPPLLVPLVTGGLERSLTLAEALEARGFGAPPTMARPRRPWRGPLTAFGLTAGAVAAYALAVGLLMPALGLTVAAGAALALAGREWAPDNAPLRRTSYREPRWGRADTLVAGSAVVVIVVELASLAIYPGVLHYEPYPSLAAPVVGLPLLLAIGLLLTPAVVEA
jgi:energy-coupling factor transport system permease protein